MKQPHKLKIVIDRKFVKEDLDSFFGYILTVEEWKTLFDILRPRIEGAVHFAIYDIIHLRMTNNHNTNLLNKKG